jgi:dipeptidyl aminopeptidase/acylaminoacyl peptidase|nr:S9 family peptidase [Kofleriaceae bacterium]
MTRLLLAIAVGACACSHAPQSATPPSVPVWPHGDAARALDFVRIGSLALSPDGTSLAYTVRSYPRDFKSYLDVMDLATGHTTEVAGKSPQWRPTGHALAYLANKQIVVDGAPLTAMANAVSQFRWSPDGARIAFLARDDDAPSTEHGPQLADDPRRLDRLWVIDIATRQVRRISKAAFQIDELAWRGDAHVVVSATDRPSVEALTNRVYEVALDTGAFTELASPPQPFRNLVVSPDGAHVAVVSTATGGPMPRDLFVDGVDVTKSLDRAVQAIQWHAQDARYTNVADGFVSRIYRNDDPIALPMSAGSFDVARDGTLAFAGEDFTHPQEIYLRAADGTIRQLTHLQPAHELAPTTIFHTASFDGTDIEAALVEPARPNRALVLLVHGGPSSRFVAGYSWEAAWARLLAAHGYQVLMVNPRGSTGYSEAFVAANRGDWGGADYKDLIAVLDAVIARGRVDATRLGIGGWSYGGEMSAWAITQSDRFRAAVVGAGVFDQQAEFETEDDATGDDWYFGTPWEHPEVYARNSPATFIAHAHTPTLIVDGVDDEDNPVGQSTGLYRALKRLGVETELVLYPGEGHSPDSGANNLDMFERFVGWYDRHLR